MLVTFSMSLFVPVLPEMVADFKSTPAHLQLTLSVFMFGFGAAQLVWGPLADRYGRKPMLVIGFAIYVAASIGAWLAPTVDILIVFRFFQAVGACSVPVVCFAIVRDIYPREQMAPVMAYITAARTIAPIIAPSLGAVIALGFGWRGTFAFMSFFGLGMLAILWVYLPETHRAAKSVGGFFRQIGSNYMTLYSDPRHVGYSLAAGFAFGAFFVFVSASSFVFIELVNLTPLAYALTFAVVAAGFGLGSFISARLLGRLGLDKTVMFGLVVALGGSGLLWLISALTALSVAAIVLPMIIVSIGVGLVLSNCQTGAIADHPTMAGAAASTSGFLVLTATSIPSAINMQFYTGSQMPMIFGVIACTVLMTVSYYVLVWRRRH